MIKITFSCNRNPIGGSI